MVADRVGPRRWVIESLDDYLRRHSGGRFPRLSVRHIVGQGDRRSDPSPWNELTGYALRLWEVLEEVDAQVELPHKLQHRVHRLLWRTRQRG